MKSCPKCNFALQSWDLECPRCRGNETPKRAAPPVVKSGAAKKPTVPYWTMWITVPICLVALWTFKGSPSRSGNSPAQIAANFERFKAESAQGAERSILSGCDLSQSASAHVQCTVSPAWFALSQAQKQTVIEGVWARWALINSPNEPHQSTLSLLGSGSTGTVASARYNLRGEWEVKVEQ